MHALGKKFLSDNERNKEIYSRIINHRDHEAYIELKERFNNFLFKIYATSYFHKSILLNSRQLKRKKSELYKREELTLNTNDLNFNEEKINRIADIQIDFIEAATKPKHIDYTEIFSDKTLFYATNNLTSNQKKILFLIFVEEFNEKEVAKIQGTSIQAVNKTKRVALKKIKYQLGGIYNGVIPNIS